MTPPPKRSLRTIHQRPVRWTVPVRWGADEPTDSSVSHNLSSHGMFIITSSPVEQGTDLQVQLQVGEEWLPLEGVVIWTRAQSEGPDRPAGFGIHLVDPSGQYLDYVKQISEAEH